MRIARVALQDGGEIYGLIEGDDVTPLASLPASPAMTDRLLSGAPIPLSAVRLLAPCQPSKIVCVGRNYAEHAAEHGAEVPQEPLIFLKPPSSLLGPGEAIVLNPLSQRVEHEAELAVVIGQRARNLTRDTAIDCVLGFTAANDVTARDLQRRDGQWSRAKGFDTFCPLGPVLVTANKIPNPNSLAIKTVLNGQTMQDWNTNDMIFDVPTLIEFLSGSTTLMPGTVILTGTPHGVGMARTPPVFMKDGDTVSVEIEQIGTLTNPVRSEA